MAFSLAPTLSFTACRVASSGPAALLRSAGARSVVAPLTCRPGRPMARAGAPSRGLAVRASMAAEVRAKNAKHKVIIYSKTYCPYCAQVKALFADRNVPTTVVELDNLADGADVAEGVAEVTGRRTVPQVFIGGKHVGGCDDTVAALGPKNGEHESELARMLEGVGLRLNDVRT